MNHRFSRRKFFKSSLMLAATSTGLAAHAVPTTPSISSKANGSRTVFVVPEATGLSPGDGHRLIELGMVEMIDGAFTGRTFHSYFNPGREIDEGAQTVHGIDRSWLEAMPKFEELAGHVSNLLSGAHFVGIRMPFPVAFLDAEFARLNLPSVSEITTGFTETWGMAKQHWPNQPCAMTDVLERLKIPGTWKDALTEATQVALAYEGMQKLKIEV